MWSMHNLGLAIWLGCNDVWPDHFTKAPGEHHVQLWYPSKPRDLVDAWFQGPPDSRHVDIRHTLDVHGRLRSAVKDALDEFSPLEEEQIARGERVSLPPHPFRKPLI